MEQLSPQEFNQLVIDHAMVVHNHCMDHCLDKDSEAYRFWSSQREHSLALCKHAALAAQEQSAYITRFSSHTEPFRTRYERVRKARLEREACECEALTQQYLDDNHPLLNLAALNAHGITSTNALEATLGDYIILPTCFCEAPEDDIIYDDDIPF